MTFQHNFIYPLKKNSDGTYNTKYKNGDKPGSNSGPSLTLNTAGFNAAVGSYQNLPVGTPVSLDISQFISGPDVAVAVIAVITVSGNDAAAGGWSIVAKRLVNTVSGGNTGGVLDVTVTDSLGVVYSFPPTAWSLLAASGSDTMAPTTPTGVLVTNRIGGFTLVSDSASDNFDGTASPSGVSKYNVYAGASLLRTFPAVTPNKGSKLATSIIGSPTGTTTAVQLKQQWTLTAAGVGAYNLPADEFIFESVQLTGDHSQSVLLDKYTSAFQYSTAGLMVRESNDPAAINVAIYLHPQGNGLRVAARTVTGGVQSNQAQLLTIDGPIRLRIDRAGDLFTFLYSLDGGKWNVLASLTVNMTSAPLWGMFATSRNVGVPITAVFHELNQSVTPLINMDIASAVSAALSITATDVSNNESPHSIQVIGSPLSSGSGKLVWKPGIRIRVGGYGSMDNINNIKAALDSIFALDINHQILGICLSPTWAQLEGPTLGDYSAGLARIKAVIALCKSYNPPRDVTIEVNCLGNGYSTQTSTSFLSSFAPAYMNSSTYDGGEVHLGLPRPYIKIWNQNVVNRLIALFAFYNNNCGPDTATGGIYRWDPIQEISINEGAGGYSHGALVAIWPSLTAGLRSAAPNTLIMMKPTFINPNDGSSYPVILGEMFKNHISISSEDTQNSTVDWGVKGYLGGWASTPVNHVALDDWDFHGNVDPAELWNESNPLAKTPPASQGSGLIYDGSPTNPGIWTRMNSNHATHADIYVDAFGGPNVVRRVFSASAPANPTPGPGAGQVTAHPNIIDVLTGNTAYAGVKANGCFVPKVSYPLSYP